MNNNNNPLWGPWREDAAGWQITSASTTDDELVDTTFVPYGDPTNIPGDALLMEALNNNVGTMDFQFPKVMGTQHQLPVLGGNIQISGNPQNQPITLAEQVVEETLANFNHKYDKYEFQVEESGRVKNKPYAVEDNCIVAKRGQAIKIKVSGAKSGHIVKMFMRFKDETYYQKPVMACRKHNIDENPNPASSFYVVYKNSLDYETESPVKYETEDGHPTAIMTVPNVLLEAFTFSPIFRCWNSCNGSICREQQMIFRLCDQSTGKVLNSTSFDIRICENVGRDSQVMKKEKKSVKRLNTMSTSKKVSHRKIKNEEDLQEEAMALDPSALMASPPHMTSNFYMVSSHRRGRRAGRTRGLGLAGIQAGIALMQLGGNGRRVPPCAGGPGKGEREEYGSDRSILCTYHW